MKNVKSVMRVTASMGILAALVIASCFLFSKKQGYAAIGGIADFGFSTKGTGPKCYLNFDDSGGPTAYDSSGNSKNGTLNAGGTGSNTAANHMWYPQGKFGGCVEFDGDDHVSVTNPSTSTSFSLSFWFRTSTPATDAYLVDRATDGHFFQLVSSKLRSGTSASHKGDSTTTIQADTWYHATMTYNGTTIRQYINAIEEFNTGGDLATPAGLELGRDYGAATYFTGLIDEVRLYDRVLTADEVSMEYTMGASAFLGSTSASFYDPWGGNPPVAWWSLDEYTGTTNYDRSGGGNDGTLTQMEATDWVHGRFGSCLRFGGDDDYVNTGMNIATGARSLSLWIKYMALPGGGNKALTGTEETAKNTYIGVQSDGSGYYGAGDSEATFNYTFSTDTWYHVALTMDGTSAIKIYVDGTLVDTKSYTADGTATQSFLIGKINSGSHVTGLIDEVKIYNYARTPAQVVWDYSEGDPVYWWKLDEGTGTSAGDSSGNNRTGTKYGTGTWEVGKFGYSYGSDGNKSGFDIGTATLINDGSDATLSFWAKVINSFTSDYIGIFDALEGSTPDVYRYGIARTTGTTGWGMYYNDGSSSGSLLGATLTVGAWQHFALVFDGNERKFYFNGELIDSDTSLHSGWNDAVRTSGSAGDVRTVGSWTHATSYLQDHSTDDVRLYNYARTAYQIKEDYLQGAAVHLGGAGTYSLDGSTSGKAATSCAQILRNFPSSTNGVYWVNPWHETAWQAYCDMTNGGWMYFSSSSTPVGFTNCAKYQNTGPSQAQCDTEYASRPMLLNHVTVTGGIQYWTAPITGTYRIEAYGAEGYSGRLSSTTTYTRPPGDGARMRGDFEITAGDEFKIIVGQQGCREGVSACGGGSYSHQPGGGGGGTFVTDTSNTPYIVAGGGGGGGQGNYGQTYTGYDAVTTTAGVYNGGSGGSGGTGCTSYNGGGAGITGNGCASSASAAQSFTNGGQGGYPNAHGTNSFGGFGGGGAGQLLPGAGGGYSGGGVTGTWSSSGRAGAGGSYNNGANQSNTAGARNGHGEVTILIKSY